MRYYYYHTLPPGTTPTCIIDFEINIQGEWILWSNRLGDDVFDLQYVYINCYPLL